MSFTLLPSTKFGKQLKKLHAQDQKRIVSELENLANNPLPKGKKVKKLIGTDAWRLRVGKARIIYFVDQKTKAIYLEDVAYRKDIY